MRKDKWLAKLSYRAPALTKILIHGMRVPFCFTSVLWNEQLPLVAKLFTVGVNSTAWKMIPALALIFFVTVSPVAPCFQRGLCCSSRDRGPQMCLFKAFAFQPSVLPGASRKLREGLGGVCGSTLLFQTSMWLPASLPALRSRAAAGPMDGAPWWPGVAKGLSGTHLQAWPQRGKPHFSLKSCTTTRFSCAVMQRSPRDPHGFTERDDGPVWFGFSLMNRNNVIWLDLFQFKKGFLVELFSMVSMLRHLEKFSFLIIIALRGGCLWK